MPEQEEYKEKRPVSYTHLDVYKRQEDDITISALAQELGSSSSQLAASFRGVYVMTPAAFLRAQKMHSAAQLLRTSDRTVLDIAGQFGSDNASKFAKAFRSVRCV